MIIRFFWYF